MIDIIKEKLESMTSTDMDAVSWICEQGVLISGNEAKLVVEMYEALQELLKAFRVINDCEIEWEPVTANPAFTNALNALAKARGEKQ